MSETLQTELAPDPGSLLYLRRLAYSDLPAVIAIERRSFPTPWSLAMFVLELSKPSGICLAAVRPDAEEGGDGDGAERLLAYLVCSRYDRVWHVMNIAVDPVERRRAIATRLLNALFERVGEDAQLTLEVRSSNGPAIALYERYGFRAAGVRRHYYKDNG